MRKYAKMTSFLYCCAFATSNLAQDLVNYQVHLFWQFNVLHSLFLSTSDSEMDGVWSCHFNPFGEGLPNARSDIYFTYWMRQVQAEPPETAHGSPRQHCRSEVPLALLRPQTWRLLPADFAESSSPCITIRFQATNLTNYGDLWVNNLTMKSVQAKNLRGSLTHHL